MDTSAAADRFFECLSTKYPSGSERVESEIKNLKRKLEIVDDEFSDCDEEQLVHQLEKVEREIKKPKLDFICDICGKAINKNGIKFNIGKHIVRRLNVENVTNNFPEITPENNTKQIVLRK